MFFRKSQALRPDAALAAMRETGTILRALREENGETIEDVAAVLKIKPAFLRDLEEGELGNMPGRTYALGFLRTYANHLRLDGREVVEQIKKQSTALPDSPDLHYRTPLSENRRPTAIALATSALMIAAIYLGWSHLQKSAEISRDFIASIAPGEPPAVPTLASPTAGEATRSADSAQGEPAEGEVTENNEPAPSGRRRPAAAGNAIASPSETEEQGTSTNPPQGDEAAQTPAQPTNANEVTFATPVDELLETQPEAPSTLELADQPEILETAALETEPAEPAFVTLVEQLMVELLPEEADWEARTLGAQPGDGRVALVASEESWIEIRTAGGERVISDVLQAGDVFWAPGSDQLLLWTGNAGGLEMVVDGNRLPRLGSSGQVLRDVSLNADDLIARRRTPN
ncbi:MAG: RodZ domain-containing protein [Geminicoccaceae bacterium]